MIPVKYIFFIWALLAAIIPAHAAPTVSATAEEALKRSRAAEGNIVGSHKLTDQDGNPVDVTRFRGRPVVISMIYTACDHTCPVTTQNVARAVAGARKALGDDSFQVLSIGFDTLRDTPNNLKMYARAQGIDLKNWTFLAGDQATMEALSAELGFTWYVTSRGFDHIAQTTVLDKDGRIYRQIYGENFELPLLVEPLKDLVLGRAAAMISLDSISDRVRFFCTVYDPHSDAYRFDYGIFLSIGSGFLAVLTIIWMTIRMWRDSRRAPRV